MKFPLILGSALAAVLSTAPVAGQETRDEVIARGQLICGSHTGLTGFGAQDATGNWQGFDVGFCRALSAAVLGDSTAVRFVPLAATEGIEALLAGDIDLLARGTVWTFQNDVAQELTFAGVSYYDGQGFIIRRALGISSALELDEVTICVEESGAAQAHLARYFRTHGMTYATVPAESALNAAQRYLAGECDAVSANIATLASMRAGLAQASDHLLLPEVISKAPLGPVTRHGDDNWSDIVRWTLFALIAAEELGVTSANVEELRVSSRSLEISRLLGTEGDLGAMLGLDAAWAARAIAAVGNYGELFASTIGAQTPLGLSRGLNVQWTQGGLLYAPPFR